jgi:hypothetical protein
VQLAEVDDDDAALRLLVSPVLFAAAHRALGVLGSRKGQLYRRSIALVAIPPIPAADLVDDEAVEHSSVSHEACDAAFNPHCNA